MEPNSVKPSMKMQMLAMVKLRSLNRCNSSNGVFMCKACMMNPAISTTPSTKLITTDMLVKLPVVPTSAREYTRAASPGESRQNPSVSNEETKRSSVSHLGSHRLESSKVTMPIGRLVEKI